MTNQQLLTIIISILATTIGLAALILAQSRALRSELREGLREASRERTELRNQIGDLRDRMGRIEGTLDVLREFFIRNGRGTAA